MKIKVNELSGAALDWAVAKCEGKPLELHVDARLNGIEQKGAWISGYYDNPNLWVRVGSLEHSRRWRYSENWTQGGPIIEREDINVYAQYPCSPLALASKWNARKGDYRFQRTGPTPLIAACRCYVASKLGDEIEVPKELI